MKIVVEKELSDQEVDAICRAYGIRRSQILALFTEHVNKVVNDAIVYDVSTTGMFDAGDDKI